jgi:hypothetical protein
MRVPFFTRALFVCSVLCAAALGSAQDPTGILHFQSAVGSFRLYNGTGTVTFTFKGTVMVVDGKGEATVSPGIKKEYEGHGRVAYFGKGSFTYKGAFRNLLWFGENMDGTWNGNGGGLFFGEFDKSLNTGYVWEASDPAAKRKWGTGGLDWRLPSLKAAVVEPKVRGH